MNTHCWLSSMSCCKALSMQVLVCRQFGALYELTQPLGRGSFKTTYLARERRGSGARVAVSVLNKERAGTTVEHNLHLIEQEVCCRLPPSSSRSWSDPNHLVLTRTSARCAAQHYVCMVGTFMPMHILAACRPKPTPARRQCRMRSTRA